MHVGPDKRDKLLFLIQKIKVSEPALPWDEQKVQISWCEDSQYFAVSSVDPITGSLFPFRFYLKENLSSTMSILFCVTFEYGMECSEFCVQIVLFCTSLQFRHTEKLFLSDAR